MEVAGAADDFRLTLGYALDLWPHLRAALIAVSTASAPPLAGSTRSNPVMRASRSISSGSRRCRYALDVTASLCACSTSAPTMRGCE